MGKGGAKKAVRALIGVLPAASYNREGCKRADRSLKHSREIAMKIHEYQAKELLAAAGAAIPRGIVVSAPAEAVQAFDTLGGGPVVLKAQIHAGGRGKGRFPGSGKDWGGVKFIKSRA